MATSEYRDAVTLAIRHGWYEVKVKGAHHVYEHQMVDGPAVRLTITENLTDNGRAYKNVLAQIQQFPEALDLLDTWPAWWASAVTFAQTLGWKATTEPNGGIRLRIPGAKSLLVRRPDRRKSEHTHEKESRAWIDRELMPRTPKSAITAQKVTLKLEGVDGVMEKAAEKWEPIAPPVMERREHVEVERIIVLEKPWMAARSIGADGAHLYPSEAVVQREWSDGTIEYVCAATSMEADGTLHCGYTSNNARSVASHFAGAHSRGKGKQPQAEVVAIDPDRTYVPTERLVEALASFLADESWDNVDELAVLALRWAHDRPDLDPERPGRGPLHREPEGETLAKIRALLGEDPRLAEMEADRDRWKGEAGALAESLARVQADLDAVREMLAGIGRSA